MLELKFSIYHRAASISSYAVLAEESLTAQWKMLLFCAKTIVKESHKFELASLKKMKKILAVWQLSGLVLSRCFLVLLGVLFIMKTLEDER